MPAQNTQRTSEQGTYSHIYNRGVEKRIIFNDEEDYAVFLGFLKDYLTPPADPKNVKKAFTVNGRTFHGVPHQPKNYFDKVELIAYSLMPNHFHLLLHQKTHGSLQNFIRSLCTRYSMYFNKKYKRTGALFAGPYKSAQIKDTSHLLHLTRYLHRGGDYSSYQEFIGARNTPWVKSEIILSLKGAKDYKNFVEKYEPNEEEKKLLAGIILEDKSEHLERKDLELAGSEQPSEKEQLAPDLNPQQSKIPFFAASTAVFVLLLALGMRNIWAATAKTKIAALPSPTPSVSGVKDIKPEPKMLIAIKIDDGSESVNIRQEPKVQSEKLGEAKDGEIFEFLSLDSGWYQIKLDDGAGFVSARYAVEIEKEN